MVSFFYFLKKEIMSDVDYKLKVGLEVESAIDGNKVKKELEKTGEQAGTGLAQGLEKKKDSRLDKIRNFWRDSKKELDKAMLAQLKMDLTQYKKDLELAKKEYLMFAKEGNEVLKNEAKKAIDSITNKIKKAQTELEWMKGSMSTGILSGIWGIWWALVAWVAVGAIKEISEKVITLGSNLQQSQIAFETILQSGEKAQALLSQLSDFASKTPFELTGIRESAKQLLAMGISAEEMVPTLKALWDVSAGLNVPLERLALNYGQVITQGKLTYKELKDFTSAGVPLADELAKNLWKSTTEVQNLASQGKISADEMVKAFQTMTSEWGRFADMMEKQSSTLSGMWSNMMDNLEWIGEQIWLALMPTLSDMVGQIGDGIEEFNALWGSGTTAGEWIARGMAVGINAIRMITSAIYSFWAVMGTVYWSAFTIVTSFFSDLWNWAKKIAENLGWAFEVAGNNIKVGLLKWINAAIGQFNSFLDWIRDSLNIDLGRIWTFEVWETKNFFWEDPFQNTKNALEGSKSAFSQTFKDIENGRSKMLTGMNEGYENIWKAFEKTNSKMVTDSKKTKKKLDTTDSSGWKWKTLLEKKKEELLKLRDLEIKAVENSMDSEFEKMTKLYDIDREYKAKLAALEGKTNDELLKTADQYIKDYYEKKVKASQEEQKLTEDAIKKAKEYEKAIKKAEKAWEDMKNKAADSLRAVNHELEEMNKDYSKDLWARWVEVKKQIKDNERDKPGLEWITKNYDKKILEQWRDAGQKEINNIDIDKVLEQIKLKEELLLLEKNTTKEQQEQAKLLAEQSETQKMINKHKEEVAKKEEYKNILEAVAGGDAIDKKLIEITDTEVKYWDAKKWEYVAITDFKNQEYARDIYNQQVKLQTEYEEAQKNYQDQLQLVKTHSNNVLSQWQSDTRAYKTELDKRRSEVQKYVADVQRMLASIPSKHRAYGWELSAGNVALVGENGPEQIIARASSYVQPRNSITNHSVVNTNQSYNLNMWDAQIGSFATIDDFLDALRSKLTYKF